MARNGFALACFFTVALSGGASAAISLVTSRAALNPVDSIDWAQFGTESTAVPDFSSGLTSSGAAFTVGGNGTDFERLDEGTSWAGNFTSGDALLFTDLGDNMTITFDQAVGGVGAQIEPDIYDPFTAHIEAFDSLNNDLGGFDLAGSSTSANDGSAIFIGVSSSGDGIKSVSFSTTSGSPTSFAVNGVSIGQLAPVPEPTSVATLALGLVGLLRRRRSNR